jgi:hypothetical protein
VNYAQLIQFKRLEERAFIFLNGRQLMYGAFGGFAGMALADKVGVTGWPVMVLVIAMAGLGIVAGSRFRGLYIYQYLFLIARTAAHSKVARPGQLYGRSPETDISCCGPE